MSFRSDMCVLSVVRGSETHVGDSQDVQIDEAPPPPRRHHHQQQQRHHSNCEINRNDYCRAVAADDDADVRYARQTDSLTAARLPSELRVAIYGISLRTPSTRQHQSMMYYLCVYMCSFGSNASAEILPQAAGLRTEKQTHSTSAWKSIPQIKRQLKIG